MKTALHTQRLHLRPLRPADAPRIQALCGNWNVARMLEVVPYPYPDGLAATWVASQPAAWRDGSAYIFGIERESQLIGIIGLERKDGGAYGLGYWLGEPWWGQGLMSEAVAAVIAFAREQLGLVMLVSAYFDDNLASGRIQAKYGFCVVGHGELLSKSRGQAVATTFTTLSLADADRRAAS